MKFRYDLVAASKFYVHILWYVSVSSEAISCSLVSTEQVIVFFRRKFYGTGSQ